MGRNKLRGLTSDEIWKRWVDRINQIHIELAFVFANRRKFLEVQEMFQKNERLSKIGSQTYQWILGHWGRDTVMAIRRELDNDRNTISFGALLDEMADRNNVVTRKRFLGKLAEPGAEEFLVRSNNESFTRWGVVSRTSRPLEDYLNAEGMRTDRQSLNKAAKPVLDYGNQLVAHRTPIGKLPLTINQIHEALDAIEPVFKKYFVILTGSALMEIEPTNVGDDWKETFKFPWYVKPS